MNVFPDYLLAGWQSTFRNDFLFNHCFPNTSSTHKLSFTLCSKNFCHIWFMGIYVYCSLWENLTYHFNTVNVYRVPGPPLSVNFISRNWASVY